MFKELIDSTNISPPSLSSSRVYRNPGFKSRGDRNCFDWLGPEAYLYKQIPIGLINKTYITLIWT